MKIATNIIKLSENFVTTLAIKVFLFIYMRMCVLPVNVIFPIGRKVIVDDQRNLLHVNSSCLHMWRKKKISLSYLMVYEQLSNLTFMNNHQVWWFILDVYEQSSSCLWTLDILWTIVKLDGLWTIFKLDGLWTIVKLDVYEQSPPYTQYWTDARYIKVQSFGNVLFFRNFGREKFYLYV